MGMLVLKVGGDIFKNGLNQALAKDVKKVLESEKLVIVHGGGDEVTEVAEKLGKKQTFITSFKGIRSRYTDEETIEIYIMVMAGKVNKTIVKWLLSYGIPAVGLSGIDGKLLTANRKKKLVIIDEKGRRRIIDGGYTGKINAVNSNLLEILIKSGYVPVVSPIALGEENEYLNVNGDRAAAQIAGALKANKIIFLTDVSGVHLGEECLKHLSLKEAKEILPKIGSGMDMKIIASIEALELGVKEAIIASGLINEPITNALKGLNGTVISSEV